MTKRICSGKIEALVELQVEKGIITKDEVMAKFKKLDKEIKERGEVNISRNSQFGFNSDYPIFQSHIIRAEKTIGPRFSCQS